MSDSQSKIEYIRNNSIFYPQFIFGKEKFSIFGDPFDLSKNSQLIREIINTSKTAPVFLLLDKSFEDKYDEFLIVWKYLNSSYDVRELVYYLDTRSDPFLFFNNLHTIIDWFQISEKSDISREIKELQKISYVKTHNSSCYDIIKKGLKTRKEERDNKRITIYALSLEKSFADISPPFPTEEDIYFSSMTKLNLYLDGVYMWEEYVSGYSYEDTNSIDIFEVNFDNEIFKNIDPDPPSLFKENFIDGDGKSFNITESGFDNLLTKLEKIRNDDISTYDIFKNDPGTWRLIKNLDVDETIQTLGDTFPLNKIGFDVIEGDKYISPVYKEKIIETLKEGLNYFDQEITNVFMYLQSKGYMHD